MDSSCESSQDDVDLEKYRKEYESYEHWELRKVKRFFFVCLHFARLECLCFSVGFHAKVLGAVR